MVKKNRSIKVVSKADTSTNPHPPSPLRVSGYLSLGSRSGSTYLSAVRTADWSLRRTLRGLNWSRQRKREMKALQKRFEAEKEKLHAQFVAEREAGYCV